jgi:hypothetical protein
MTFHQILLGAFAPLTGPAHLVDATTRGTEELVLLVDRADSPAAAEAAGGGPSSGVAAPRGSWEIHLLLTFSQPLFWSEPTQRKKPYASSGFGNWIRTQLRGAALQSVSGGRSARIARFEFAMGTARIHVILDPLPNACRVLVTDGDGTIIQRYPPPVHAAAAGRGQAGSRYEEPAGTFREPWQRWIEEAGRPLPAVTEDTPWYICLPGFPDEAASDARAGEERLGALLSPVPPADLPGTWELFGSGRHTAQEAARELARLHIRHERTAASRRDLVRLLRSEEKQLQRLATRVAAEVEDTQQGPLLRRKAEALLANARRIPRGASQVTLDDPSHPGEVLTIELDPARGFAETANALFRRAGRLERAREQRAIKAADVRRWLALVSAWRNEAARPLSPTGRDETRVRDLFDSIMHLASQGNPVLDPGLKRRLERFRRDVGVVAEQLTRPHEQRGYDSRGVASRDPEGLRVSGGAGTSRSSGAAGAAGAPGTPNARRSRSSGRVAQLGTAGHSAKGRTRSRAGSEGGAAAGGIHPRRFELSGGWTVLVGRSNRENDLLTHKLARQRDLWFHARGVAGSHVVLQRGGRKDNPSRDTLEAAASIAAHFSKARTSGLVPVIYTEKRYVRKPRKAPPGLAVCLREKVLMVEPKLPPGSEPGSDAGFGAGSEAGSGEDAET